MSNESKLMEIRAVLKPSIVGLGPKELYVQPLWSNDNPHYHKIKIKNNFYFATKKSNSVIHSSYTYTRHNTAASRRSTPSKLLPANRDAKLTVVLNPSQDACDSNDQGR